MMTVCIVNRFEVIHIDNGDDKTIVRKFLKIVYDISTVISPGQIIFLREILGSIVLLSEPPNDWQKERSIDKIIFEESFSNKEVKGSIFIDYKIRYMPSR